MPAALLMLSLGIPACAAPALPPDQLAYLCEDVKKPFFLQKRDQGGVRTMASGRPQANDSEFLLPKPKGTRRVFVVGESAAAMLSHGGDAMALVAKSLWPGQRVEAVNCGMGAYDSERILPVAAEVLGYEPDAVVVLSGNNESVPIEVCDEPLDRARNALTKALRRAPGHDENLRRHEARLREMARLAKARGVSIVFCTLPVNQRDWAPNRAPDLANSAFARGRFLLERGKPKEAAASFKEALRDSPRDPFFHYYLARAQEASGDFKGALEHYEQAVEWDMGGRRSSRMRNDMIRRVSKEENAVLADLAAVFAGRSPHGIIGFSMMRDYAHWRISNNALVARIVWGALATEWGLTPVGNAGAVLPIDPQGPEDPGRIILLSALSAFNFPALWREGADLVENSVWLLDYLDRSDRGFLAKVAGSKGAAREIIADNFWARDLGTNLESWWPLFLHHVGEMHRRRGELKRGLAYLDEAIRLSPGNSSMRVCRGLAYAGLGDPARAQEDFRAASADARRRAELSTLAEVYGVPFR